MGDKLINREYFLRGDLETFKRKFKAVCRETKLEIKKYSTSLAQEENKCYISRIEIKEK